MNKVKKERSESQLSIQDRKNIAVENKQEKGYNCAQSVVCAFKDMYDLPESLLLQISEGFGLGMGTGSVCGAVTAMSILAGLEISDGKTQGSETKLKTREFSADCFMNFEQKNKSAICFELKGETGGPMLRSCQGCIEDAVEIFCEKITAK